MAPSDEAPTLNLLSSQKPAKLKIGVFGSKHRGHGLAEDLLVVLVLIEFA